MISMPSPCAGARRPFSAVPNTVRRYLPALVTLLIAADPDGGAQTRSPVLKDPSAERSPFYLKVDRSTEILFDAFMLVKKANTGDPVAEHELGLRYLQGTDFTPDTARAALWIARSAARDYLPAIYNLGILKNNGWGTEWDPFGAFRNFQRAAAQGMQEGMYMTGLFFTDNLVVRKNYGEAHRWIGAAADSGNRYAREVLSYFEKSGIMAQIHSRPGDPPNKDSSSGRPPSPGLSRSYWRPVFLDPGTDTLADPDDSTLAREALHFADDDIGEDAGGADDAAETVDPVAAFADSTDILRIVGAAGAGSPEALTFLGRRCDRGAGVPRDRVEAAFYYIRAIRSESRWSPVLLWRLASDPSLYDQLALRTGRGDPKAAYVWAGLIARGFDRRLTEGQALEHLWSAARGGVTDAMVELAAWYDAGYVVTPDTGTADSLMTAAANLGSREARVRLLMKTLRAGEDVPVDPAVTDTLIAMRKEGSVLAQVMLGYCYERGRGLPASIPRAVAFYRKAAQRGSRMAYDALMILHDGRRPPGPEFSVEDAGE